MIKNCICGAGFLRGSIRGHTLICSAHNGVGPTKRIRSYEFLRATDIELPHHPNHPIVRVELCEVGDWPGVRIWVEDQTLPGIDLSKMGWKRTFRVYDSDTEIPLAFKHIGSFKDNDILYHLYETSINQLSLND